MGEGGHCHKSGCYGFDGLAGDDNPASVMLVRRVACGKNERNHGKELCQPHKPERSGAVSEGINLPAHGHGLHLRGKSRQRARCQNGFQAG